ncbi:MAG TPA: AbrB/MazE/SpoVT family DNA-binding domain-containing protein [Candidatus Nanoarchaeia archaeon]|nr:AbrB/MazE/SpoVT family DNA-binding domain-containing protein [Candidatus Nanoarchaeia archaeon]
MTGVVNVGEKGQIVIPKNIRKSLNIEKGTKLLVAGEKDRIILKPAKLTEKHLYMLLSEESLKKTWDNTYDERWDEVL